jgi:hypothetical protein
MLRPGLAPLSLECLTFFSWSMVSSTRSTTKPITWRSQGPNTPDADGTITCRARQEALRLPAAWAPATLLRTSHRPGLAPRRSPPPRRTTTIWPAPSHLGRAANQSCSIACDGTRDTPPTTCTPAQPCELVHPQTPAPPLHPTLPARKAAFFTFSTSVSSLHPNRSAKPPLTSAHSTPGADAILCAQRPASAPWCWSLGRCPSFSSPPAWVREIEGPRHGQLARDAGA